MLLCKEQQANVRGTQDFGRGNQPPAVDPESQGAVDGSTGGQRKSSAEHGSVGVPSASFSCPNATKLVLSTSNPHLQHVLSVSLYVDTIMQCHSKSLSQPTRILNIRGGGRHTSPIANEGRSEYYALDLAHQHNLPGISFLQGDITDPNLAESIDMKFDVIYTKDTFEHVLAPWDATGNVLRLLDEGGLFIFIAPFSWRYHSYPYDTFRYSHVAVQHLFGRFGGLKTIFAGYSKTNSNRGFWASKKDATLDGSNFRECIETVYVAQRDTGHKFDITVLDSNHEYS